jgi:hypothetical protein
MAASSQPDRKRVALSAVGDVAAPGAARRETPGISQQRVPRGRHDRGEPCEQLQRRHHAVLRAAVAKLLDAMDVIAARADAQLPTWVTTWMTPQAISERYGDGIARRLYEAGRVTVIACGKGS